MKQSGYKIYLQKISPYCINNDFFKEENINNLIEQFKAANGIRNVDISSPLFISEFNEWLSSRNQSGKSYLSFIDSMEVYPSLAAPTVEVGKGKYDSVVLGTDISIISPYPFDGVKHSARIITGNFNVSTGKPIITTEKKMVLTLKLLIHKISEDL